LSKAKNKKQLRYFFQIIFFFGLAIFAFGVVAFLLKFFNFISYVVPAPSLPTFVTGDMSWSLAVLNWPVIIGIVLAIFGAIGGKAVKSKKEV
jgi:hypothetical protein